MLTREELLELGFKEVPHFTVGDSLFYDLERDRLLTVSNIATPNEMMFICEVDNREEPIKITDAVVLHNYDYDGYLGIDKIKILINVLTGRIL